ncbi:MAG: glycosyltransferase [Planctomycetales bacterium]|nr:glycosyltransferase [Planctomycetales bacterium]
MTNRAGRPPLRVVFITTSMYVGGAETLLINLMRRMDRQRYAVELVCLKEAGPLGEEAAREFPVAANLIANKWDLRILPRLVRHLQRLQADAVITVGAGDKMFWGRLAARLCRVPAVCSALHSTGWPDEVGRLNRCLTPLTDAFIGVADAQSQYLVEAYGFPRQRVHTIYNGVDTERFTPRDGVHVRRELGLDVNAPVVSIVAALRPEKNHEMFLQGAARLAERFPAARFLVIGDGPRRADLERLAIDLGVAEKTLFLGSRSDVPELLNATDVLALTSHNEASPVSILEALSAGCAVASADVGSVGETVVDGSTGRLFSAGDLDGFIACCSELLERPDERRRLAAAGRSRVVEQWSLDSMVRGYEQLISQIHAANAPIRGKQRFKKWRGIPRWAKATTQ